MTTKVFYAKVKLRRSLTMRFFMETYAKGDAVLLTFSDNVFRSASKCCNGHWAGEITYITENSRISVHFRHLDILAFRLLI